VLIARLSAPQLLARHRIPRLDLMTGPPLPISIRTSRPRRAVSPEVRLRSPFTDTNRISHAAIAPLSPQILPKPSPFWPFGAARNPQIRIENAAAFRTRLRSSSVNPNSLGDQQHGSPQALIASGVPMNAYDVNAYDILDLAAIGESLNSQNERPRTTLNVNGFVEGPSIGLLKRKMKSPSTK
jgi:hypothetical protein